MDTSLPPVGVIGGGSWGTSLALLLAQKGHPVDLWIHNPELTQLVRETGENPHYLPGFSLPDNLKPSSRMEEVVSGKEYLLSVVPSHLVREVMAQSAPFLEDQTLIISASKGVEGESLGFVDDVLEDILPPSLHPHLCFLAGPSFAREVAAQKPTGVVIASREKEPREQAQSLMSTDYFRVYTSADVKGCLVGGAVKNVIAIATGICDGLDLGANSRAALITRGLAEIVRLGEKLDADPLTFSGLAGMGDLVLTCTGNLSRNRTVGLKLGQGQKLSEILGEMKMIAEGVKTAPALHQLSNKLEVEMPIVHQVHSILYEDKPPAEAVVELMSRPLKSERS